MFILRARPSTKVKNVATVTSVRKPGVPPMTSTSTSTKTTPSAPVSTDVTIAASHPPIPESILTTRVKTPPAAKSQPQAGIQYAMTSASKATSTEAAKGPLIQPSPLTIDYSRLRIGDNKSFMEAWEEASKLNEEAAWL